MNRRFLYLFCLIMYSSVSLFAQVTVAPFTVFLDSHNRFATFMIINNSPTAQEISIEFRFGYPVTDAAGKTTMQFNDSITAASRSINPYIKAFPKKCIIQHGEQQVVRIMASVPDSLADGTYWTRLITRSNPPENPIDTLNSKGIQTKINFVLEQITTVMFRKGTATTSAAIDTMMISSDSANVHVLARIKQGGNSPLLGKTILNVFDREGNKVYSTFEISAYYFTSYRNLNIPKSVLRNGSYRAELEISSERTDIPAEHILPMAPVRAETDFTIQ